MYYIIGPRESAAALARKTGLRAGEWVNIERTHHLPERRLDLERDRLLSTHDVARLPNGEWRRIEYAVLNMTDGEIDRAAC